MPAVIVASSAAPAILARLFTSMVGLLKKAARLLGAKRVDVLFVGLAAKVATSTNGGGWMEDGDSHLQFVYNDDDGAPDLEGLRLLAIIAGADFERSQSCQ